MKTALVLLLWGCATLGVPLTDKVVTVQKENDPYFQLGLNIHGVKTIEKGRPGNFAFSLTKTFGGNPWMARKYQDQLTREYQHDTQKGYPGYQYGTQRGYYQQYPGYSAQKGYYQQYPGYHQEQYVQNYVLPMKQQLYGLRGQLETAQQTLQDQLTQTQKTEIEKYYDRVDGILDDVEHLIEHFQNSTGEVSPQYYYSKLADLERGIQELHQNVVDYLIDVLGEEVYQRKYGQQYPYSYQHEYQYPNSYQYGQQYPSGYKYGQQYPQSSQYGHQYPQGSQYGHQYPQSSQYGQRYPESSKYGHQYPQSYQYGQQYPQSSKYGQQYPQSYQYGQQYAQGYEYGQQYPSRYQAGQQYPSSYQYPSNYQYQQGYQYGKRTPYGYQSQYGPYAPASYQYQHGFPSRYGNQSIYGSQYQQSRYTPFGYQSQYGPFASRSYQSQHGYPSQYGQQTPYGLQYQRGYQGGSEYSSYVPHSKIVRKRSAIYPGPVPTYQGYQQMPWYQKYTTAGQQYKNQYPQQSYGYGNQIPYQHRFGPVEYQQSKYGVPHYQQSGLPWKSVGYHGVLSKQQRQQSVGVLPNQWDEDQNEQGTFEDIAFAAFTSPTNQDLQQQIQVGQVEAQNVQMNPQTEEIQIAEPEIILKQLQVLRLLKNINQPTPYDEIAQIGSSYSVVNNADKYTDQYAVKNYIRQYERGLLPRGEIFSVFNPEHLKQLVTLFKLLYHARDWETFYNTAAWARVNVNEGIFQHALVAALVQRGDTDLLVVPGTYEINPQYFVNSQVIQKAQDIKQFISNSPQQKDFVIVANYTGWDVNVDPEQYLSYFLEDVGLNDYYYYYYMNYPFWMNSEYLQYGGDRRGEQAYYFLQQLLARYYMERLSNGMGHIPDINLGKQSVETGYVPSLRYPNGLEFPPRPSNVYLGRDEEVEALQKIVRRIQDAIDSGLVVDESGNIVHLSGEEGFDTLLNIMQSTPESPNPDYYSDMGMLIRWVLGNSLEPLDQNKLVPSALEHVETTLRDPVAWQAIKKVVKLAQQYKSRLPSYNYQQLAFPGVQVQSVQVDPLVTYFDQFDLDITNAVYVNDQEPEDSVKIWARQARLNNKPFAVKINVNSQQSQPAVVRIFLGPKYDEYGREININENRLNFFELDKFLVQLQSGSNNIVRNSREMNFDEDTVTGHELYQQVQQALNQQGVLQVQYSDLLTSFPIRLLLPKGQRGGQPFQIYVIVSPLVQTPEQQQALQQLQQTVLGSDPIVQKGILNQYVDSLPLGYPFDREIDEAIFEDIPNAYMADVVIVHEGPEIAEAQGQLEYTTQMHHVH